MGTEQVQSCHGFKLAPCIYFLTSMQLARACWEIWNLFSNSEWPRSLEFLATLSTYLSCGFSCTLVVLSLFATVAVILNTTWLARMMWWCIYLTMFLDTVNNLGYLSLLGFGMHPFVVQCVGGDEKTKTTCPDHNCSLWNQCTQVWQMAIIWVAITTALSFVLNSVLLYCIHQVRRSEPIAGPPPPCKQPYASSFFDYNRPAPRMAPHNPYVSNISEPEGLYIRQSTLK